MRIMTFPRCSSRIPSAAMDDPLTGGSGALLRGDDTDPKLIETNTATEYWQKGASLLHTDPLGTRDVALPANVRTYLLPGTQHAGKAGMPRDNGPCINPRNWHDPMPAVRALLVALDEWVTTGRTPPDSRVPRIDDGTLVAAENVAFPAIPGLVRPRAANDATLLADWTDPAPAAPFVRHVGAAGGRRRKRNRGNPAAGYRGAQGDVHRLEPVQIPLPRGRTRRPRRHVPGVRGDRGRTGERSTGLVGARYPGTAYADAVRAVTAALLQDRLLLQEDADRYLQ